MLTTNQTQTFDTPAPAEDNQQIFEDLDALSSRVEALLTKLSAESSKLRASGQSQRARIYEGVMQTLDSVVVSVIPPCKRALDKACKPAGAAEQN